MGGRHARGESSRPAVPSRTRAPHLACALPSPLIPFALPLSLRHPPSQRVSRGLRISAFHGHFFIRGTDLLALPNIDEDKAFAVEIAHEENALSSQTCCMQAALLYTTSSGERRIRVHTIQLPVTNALVTLHESADIDACANLLGRVAIDTAMGSTLLAGAEKLQNGCLEALRAYRGLCPNHAKQMNTLLLPEPLKLLPLYALALMKSPIFSSGGDVRPDERSHLMYLFGTLPVAHTTAMLHPRLLRVHPPMQSPSGAPAELPPPMALSAQSIQQDGAYLIEDGLFITLWLGRAVPTEFLQQAFGWPTLDGVDASALRLLPADSSPLAAYLNGVVDLLRQHRASGWLALRVVKQVRATAAAARAAPLPLPAKPLRAPSTQPHACLPPLALRVVPCRAMHSATCASSARSSRTRRAR